MRLRNLFFDWHIFKATPMNALVVSVGNISAGGTGKTPITAYLSRLLLSKGYRLSIVSRGYGGKYKEDAICVDITTKNASSYFGDEPVMLATQLKIPVFVSKSRVSAAKMAIEEAQSNCILADDGFQHRWLKRNIDIVVFDATETQRCVLPMGRLRESMDGLKRAQVIFVTRASQVAVDERDKILKMLESYGFSQKNKNMYFVEFNIANIVHVHTYARMMENQCFLVSGIGKPQNFERAIQQKYIVHKHYVFADHYSWTQTEWSEIINECQKNGGHPIVMTEKDAVKIRNLNSDNYPIYFASLDVEMDKSFDIDVFLNLAGV